MNIVFENVGREKWSGTVAWGGANTKRAIEAFAETQASKHLLSRDVEAFYHPGNKAGVIRAGFRDVGTFKVEVN